ncbi:IspD/TarI family cytidylyltransferase [Vagococcus fluvialis]|uniref:IspD/TarI family cytidylyltransferase n=1 Tax=Vagococcus fluvialis TaxID=2738 RepID=UPI003D0AD6C8
MNIALLTAGGSGTRMNMEIPKQFLTVREKPIIIYTLEQFEKHPNIDAIIVVCKEGWEEILSSYAKQFKISKLKHIVIGGQTGQESINNGIKELSKFYDNEDLVLVHDGNRCLVSEDIISNCIAIANKNGNAVAVIPTVEAVVKSRDNNKSADLLDRTELFRTQTPHGFKLGKILELHEKAKTKGIVDSVATCTLSIDLGEEIYFCKGSEKNLKITTEEDLDIFKSLISI